MTAFDSNVYCDFSAVAAKAFPGKDILVCVFSENGSKLLAIAGQKSGKINRKTASIDASSKDTPGGWKSSVSGMKEWGVDVEGLFIPSDETHKQLGKAFENGTPVCLKLVNMKTKKAMYGGLASLTDYSIDAPYEDMVTYSLTFEGMGALKDLSALESEDEAKVTALPTGSEA